MVENAPISRAGLNVQYASMGQAAREEFLDLPEGERRKADDAFRVATIFGHPMTGVDLSHRNDFETRRLVALTRAYEEQLEYEMRSLRLWREGRGSRAGWPAPDAGSCPNEGPVRDGHRPGPSGAHAVVQAVLGIVEDANRSGRPDLTERPEWAQLCCVALADTDLLSSSLREAISSGDTVCPRVRDAYFLAKYKVFNYRMSLGGLRRF